MARTDADRIDSLSTTSTAAPRRRWMLASAAAIVIVASLVARGVVGTSTAEAQSPSNPPPANQPNKSHRVAPVDPNAPGPPHDVMAIVNGQDISRPALAQACVERHGETILGSLVNKRLIEHHCRKRDITITEADIEAEVDRMAKRFKLGREQWLDLLEKQRNVTAAEYKRDILWPTIALRKLASEELTVTEAEITKAYESRFGASVRTRLIVVSSEEKAQQIHREVTARPEEFARLAMRHSEDINSASIGGLIQPIRPHAGEPAIERAAFNLSTGEVSGIISASGQFAILKCEGHLPARSVPKAEVRAELAEGIKEDKLRGVANDLFAKLQATATVQNIYNDPQLRQTMPGVVATINGDPISMKELGNECLMRHGEEVLLTEISQLLLRQEIKAAGLSISQQDLKEEMKHAARLAGIVGPDGEPNLQQWVQAATQEQGLSYEMYVRDSVWPSAALKKLTSGRVEVTEADLEKGFEANYGERVRCLAIVLGELRRAQEVWDKARQNPSEEFFGDLAEQYSVEPSSRSLRGEVPPIRRNSGQPQLEKAAFVLAEGELSGITQVGDKFILLKCLGRTEPLDITPSEVRELLTQDLFEKKLRIAMSEEFARVQSKARIDNYLAGTSQSPPKKSQHASRKRDGAVQQTSGQR